MLDEEENQQAKDEQIEDLDLKDLPKPMMSKNFALVLALRFVEATIDREIATQFPTSHKVEIGRSQFHNGVFPSAEIVKIVKKRYGEQGWTVDEEIDNNSSSYGKKLVLK